MYIFAKNIVSEESVEYFMATQLFTKDMNQKSVKILYLAAELLGAKIQQNEHCPVCVIFHGFWLSISLILPFWSISDHDYLHDPFDNPADWRCPSCDVHLQQAQESMGEEHERTTPVQKEDQEAREKETCWVQCEWPQCPHCSSIIHQNLCEPFP